MVAFYLSLIKLRTIKFPHLIYKLTFFIKASEKKLSPNPLLSRFSGTCLAPHGLHCECPSPLLPKPWSHGFPSVVRGTLRQDTFKLLGLFGTWLAPSECLLQEASPTHPNQYLPPWSSLLQHPSSYNDRLSSFHSFCCCGCLKVKSLLRIQ